MSGRLLMDNAWARKPSLIYQISRASACFEGKSMNLDRVDAGRDLANDFNVIVEIPMNADPIKYEIDKATGALFVDRFLSTAMHYPCNYGYIPHTISDDG